MGKGAGSSQSRLHQRPRASNQRTATVLGGAGRLASIGGDAYAAEAAKNRQKDRDKQGGG